ncbi:MAG TPA: ADOP family duplicated permease, partial [Bryobacteraceae bacterium]|nr:ADOP family duplicated permease [Bryobacteraceae bacterium]
VLLGYRIWMREFGGRADVVGKIVRLDARPYTVIGVLPRNAVFPEDDFWTPQAPVIWDRARILNGVGRLKAGVTFDQARADLIRVHKSAGGVFQVGEVDTRPALVPLRDHYLGDYRRVTMALLGAVGILLLISCLNIAAWMVARGTSRSRELAIRAALGARRGRLIRQLLAESFWLASAGGAAGVGLGWLALRGILALMPDVLPAWVRFRLDARFAAFALLATAAAALVSGLAPAVQLSRVDLRRFLGGAHVSGSRRYWRGMSVLVIAEIALTVVVLSAAGLVLSAFHKVLSVDPGFNAHNLVTFGFDLDEKYHKDDSVVQFYQELMPRLRAIPGVESASATDMMPLGVRARGAFYFEVEGEPAHPMMQEPVVPVCAIEPGYFRAMGIALRSGRDIEERDEANAVIVNDAFANHFWPRGTNVIGRRVLMGPGRQSQWLTVVGVVRNVRQDGLEQDVTPAAYVASRWNPNPTMTIVIRSTVDPNSLIASARAIIRQMDPDLTLFDVQTMQERLDRSLWIRRTYSWLLGVFAGIALVMATTGIYGVVAYAVTQRTREIGIRIALGAEPRQVLGEVLRRGMALAAVGVALGLAGAVAATRLIQSLLAGVSPHDPWIFVAVSILLALAALAANLVPARRAANVDPVDALRFE